MARISADVRRCIRELDVEKMAKTIEGHLEGVLGFWEFRGASNAKTEGFNKKIRWLIKQAYGYRDFNYFRLKIFDLPNLKPRDSDCRVQRRGRPEEKSRHATLRSHPELMPPEIVSHFPEQPFLDARKAYPDNPLRRSACARMPFRSHSRFGNPGKDPCLSKISTSASRIWHIPFRHPGKPREDPARPV